MYSKDHVFKGSCIQRIMYSKDNVFKGSCIQRIMYSKDHVFKGSCIQRIIYSKDHVFKGTVNVTQSDFPLMEWLIRLVLLWYCIAGLTA